MNEYYNPNNQGEYNNPNTQQNYYNQNTQPQQPPYQAPVYQPINQTNEVMRLLYRNVLAFCNSCCKYNLLDSLARKP